MYKLNITERFSPLNNSKVVAGPSAQDRSQLKVKPTRYLSQRLRTEINLRIFQTLLIERLSKRWDFPALKDVFQV